MEIRILLYDSVYQCGKASFEGWVVRVAASAFPVVGYIRFKLVVEVT